MRCAPLTVRDPYSLYSLVWRDDGGRQQTFDWINTTSCVATDETSANRSPTVPSWAHRRGADLRRLHFGQVLSGIPFDNYSGGRRPGLHVDPQPLMGNEPWLKRYLNREETQLIVYAKPRLPESAVKGRRVAAVDTPTSNEFTKEEARRDDNATSSITPVSLNSGWIGASLKLSEREQATVGSVEVAALPPLKGKMGIPPLFVCSLR